MSLMRHDCHRDGCYHDKHVVKFDRFEGKFPRGINFTDIDMFLEYGNHFLFIDWKCQSEIKTGQNLCYSRLAKVDGFTVAIVLGDCESMECSHIKVYRSNGECGEWEPCNIDDFDYRIQRWRERIDSLKSEA